ncbi:ATP synthase I chain [Oligella ureolytica]|uniref:ATP synthase I chain n=1 Tax=Oligella ureolytica TaxID=90244 RepID=A0A378XFT3_9BURK|nr:ATP synthase subunit I [Oligella ureolytica]QPT39389.1 ATP synthase subunit I [Oligella ureolytica]SUA55970.1 ATP synthase I chain [Oligella ureolytica]SUA57308.1 ATP synthase I chain [Oligella ureolytica]
MNQEQFEAIKLSPEDKQRMRVSAMRGLLRLVIAQGLALLIVSFLALVFAGLWAGLSAFAGGMTYLIPTSMFVLHLVLKLLSKRDATAVTFFIGEAIKIGVAMVLMYLVVKVFGSNLVWPAFFVGLLVVLKAYVLLLVFKKL